MKKLLFVLVGLLLLAGCSKKPQESVSVKVASLKGPTSMGLVKLMEDKKDNPAYTFEILSAVDEVVGKISNKEVDLATIPANMASILYNNTDKEIQVLAINTLGVLYLCQINDDIKDISDLKSKTIYASGKGATPEYALAHILSKNNLEIGKDVFIEWKSEHTETLNALQENPDALALLPQPFVSVAQSKNDKVSIGLDLTKEWEKVEPESKLVTGVLVGNKDFIENNKSFITNFLKDYKASIDYVNTDIEASSQLIESYDIVKAPIAKKAIPYTNITYLDSNEMKVSLAGYLKVLFSQNPKAIGNSLPDSDFYYENK